MANLFTDKESALHFIKTRYEDYKYLLKKLKYFMNENEVQNNSELLVCVLSCVSNVLYFDVGGVTSNDFELATLKHDLVGAVGFIIL